jgi:hypothetical protein
MLIQEHAIELTQRLFALYILFDLYKVGPFCQLTALLTYCKLNPKP